MSVSDGPQDARVSPNAPATRPAVAAPRPSQTPRRPWPTWARALLLGAAGASAVAGCVSVYLVDPAEPGHYPSCPFFALTGLDCPGCGTGRGLHQLLHGNVAGAADFNVFLVLLLPLLVGIWAVEVARLLGWQGRPPAVPDVLVKALPVAIVAFWVVRNLPLPGATWLAAT